MRKKALVLSGGGGKGAYQIGAIKALKECNKYEEICAFSGASIGAVNISLAQVITVDQMTDIWLNTDIEDILENEHMKKNINYKYLRSLVNNKNIERMGFFSRKGLVEIFKKIHIEKIRDSYNNIFISIVDITDIPEDGREINIIRSWLSGRKVGETKYSYINKQNRNNIYKILLASSSIPLIFKPIEIDGRLYIDGGLNENLPIKPLYQNGYRDITAITCNKINKSELQKQYPNADIKIIQPSRYLGNIWTGTLNFSSSKIRELITLGYNDTLLEINKKNSRSSSKNTI